MKFVWTAFILKATVVVLLGTVISEALGDSLSGNSRLSFSLWSTVIILAGYLLAQAIRENRSGDKLAEKSSLQDQESESWKKALQNLSDVLKEGQRSQENLARSWNEKAEELLDVQNKVLKEGTQDLSGTAQAIKEELKAFTQELKLSLVEGQKEAAADFENRFEGQVKNLLSEVNNNITGSHKENLVAVTDSLNQKIGESVDSLANRLSENQEKTLQAQKSEMESLAEKVTEQMKNNQQEFLETQRSGVENLVSSLGEEIKASTQATNDSLIESQANGTSAMVDAMQSQIQDLIESQKGGTLSVVESLQNQIQALVENLGNKMLEGHKEQLESLSNHQNGVSEVIEKWMTTQGESFEKLLVSFTETAQALDQAGKVLTESSELSEVNQVEMKTSIDTMSDSLARIVDKLEAKIDGEEDQGAFMERLNQTLEAFHEKATEALIENSLKTREILSELLNQKGEPA